MSEALSYSDAEDEMDTDAMTSMLQAAVSSVGNHRSGMGTARARGGSSRLNAGLSLKSSSVMISNQMSAANAAAALATATAASGAIHLANSHAGGLQLPVGATATHHRNNNSHINRSVLAIPGPGGQLSLTQLVGRSALTTSGMFFLLFCCLALSLSGRFSLALCLFCTLSFNLFTCFFRGHFNFRLAGLVFSLPSSAFSLFLISCLASFFSSRTLSD